MTNDAASWLWDASQEAAALAASIGTRADDITVRVQTEGSQMRLTIQDADLVSSLFEGVVPAPGGCADVIALAVRLAVSQALSRR